MRIPSKDITSEQAHRLADLWRKTSDMRDAMSHTTHNSPTAIAVYLAYDQLLAEREELVEEITS